MMPTTSLCGQVVGDSLLTMKDWVRSQVGPSVADKVALGQAAVKFTHTHTLSVSKNNKDPCVKFFFVFNTLSSW